MLFAWPPSDRIAIAEQTITTAERCGDVGSDVGETAC
jgi:hypothetical protein